MIRIVSNCDYYVYVCDAARLISNINIQFAMCITYTHTHPSDRVQENKCNGFATAQTKQLLE